MHFERDTLWYFMMSIVKYRESHYVRVIDIYGENLFSVVLHTMRICKVFLFRSINYG